jgi:hypothetical protein
MVKEIVNLICFPKVGGGGVLFRLFFIYEQDKLFDLIDQQLNNNVLDDEA